MDTSRLRHPKPPSPAKLRADKRKAQAALERRENAKVKARSGGRCEVVCLWGDIAYFQCDRRAAHIHHLISGNGKRGRGVSVYARHKQHVCTQDHRDIHGDVGGKRLVLDHPSDPPLWSDTYRRVR